MAENSSARCRMAPDRDRISNLPKEVSDEILYHLPIREAVRTSFLSTCWRYRWMSMPHLMFDSLLHTKLVPFLNAFLLLHDGTISKFELHYHYIYAISITNSHMDNWIQILSRKRTNHLILDVGFHPHTGYKPYTLPASLFSCQTLRSLDLKGCAINLPGRYKGFSHLTLLQLSSVTVNNETFQRLVEKIPPLQTLIILGCYSLTHVNINAPNLVKVRISGPLEVIKFQNAPKVEVLYIRVSSPKKCRCFEFLAGLEKVQAMEIYEPTMEIPSTNIAPERWRGTFGHLTDVNLFVQFDDTKQILAVLCLCRSSLFLRRMKITAVWDKGVAEDFSDMPVHREYGALHHLETLSLIAIKGVKNEMGLIRFILLNAVALKTFSIKWDKSISYLKILHCLEEVMQFQKASSPKCSFQAGFVGY